MKILRQIQHNYDDVILDKFDSDRSQTSDLNHRSCSVPTNHTDMSEIYQR